MEFSPLNAALKDLSHCLDQEYLSRLWTYQELMLSRNPVIVCGDLTLAWWRFAISILYLNCITYQRHSEASKLLLRWKSLVMDRNELEILINGSHNSLNGIFLDLKLYHHFPKGNW